MLSSCVISLNPPAEKNQSIGAQIHETPQIVIKFSNTSVTRELEAEEKETNTLQTSVIVKTVLHNF